MRILIVVPNFGIGGADRVASLMSLLLAVRHEVMVSVFYDQVRYPHGGALEPLGLRYYEKRSPTRKLLASWRKLRYLRQLVRRFRPTAVLSMTEEANFVSLLIRLREDTPVVAVSQIAASRVYNGIFGPVLLRLMRMLYARADGIVAVSEGARRDLVDRLGVAEHRIEVIPNAVDLTRIRESAREPVEDALWHSNVPIVLNIGRLAAQKNQALLLRAFRHVRHQTGAHLAILGTGGLLNRLQAFAGELGLDGSVHFLGWRDNPFKYMRQASVFVLSSDYEGLPVGLIEALAVGCPVVSTDCPYGPSEVLGEGRYGLLAPVGDESALADAMLRVLTDERLRLELVERGRERAQDFDVAKIAARYETALERVVSNRLA